MMDRTANDVTDVDTPLQNVHLNSLVEAGVADESRVRSRGNRNTTSVIRRPDEVQIAREYGRERF